MNRGSEWITADGATLAPSVARETRWIEKEGRDLVVESQGCSDGRFSGHLDTVVLCGGTGSECVGVKSLSW